MQEWWWAVVPMALAAAGYLMRRWLERRRLSEALKRKLQALALHQGLEQAHLTLDDLRDLEKQVAE